MDNKYLFAVVAGVFAFAWFWVGIQPYYAMEGGGISTGFLWTAVVVLALGGGDSEGSDLISVLTSSVTGFIPNFIGLLIAYIVGGSLFSAFAMEGGFDVNFVLSVIADLFASGILIILTVGCLKKSS